MNKVTVDKTRLLRRVIVISWITLALCFVVKIFGGNFFEIMCENPNYKALCEYADNHLWCKYILAVCSSMICQSFYTLAIIQEYRFNKAQLILTVVSVLIGTYIKYLSQFWGFLFDIWTFFVLPLVFLGKQFKSQWWQVPIAYALSFGFQLISLLAKNISVGIIDNSTFVSLIFGIDIYIMCFLYYLYRNYKKEQKVMGMFWGIFMGKPVDKLKEMKAKREKQIAKLNEEIKAIEEAIKAQSNK